LVAPCPHSLRSDPSSVDALLPTLVMLEQVFRESGRFDLIHFHTDWLHFPLCRRQRCSRLTTLHGRLDLPCLPSFFR
jgi:hypothetical protein